MKKLLLIMVLMGFLSAFIIHAEFTSMGFCSNSTVRLVNPGESIQEAINSANNGDTILVEEGLYNEKEIVVNKTVNLVGKDAKTTIIDGESNANYILHVIADNLVIENFTLQNTKQEQYESAIQLYRVTNVSIRNVYILNSSIGIHVQSTNYSKIAYSTIGNCKSWAIRFHYGSCNNTVIGNTFENNPTALLIADLNSKFNLIYHNNFINNTNQAQSFGSPNYFDNGYPSGGNCWSEHIVPDRKRGPYQNETGSDGILDVGYPNAENPSDKYPLANPIKTLRIQVNKENFEAEISTNSTLVYYQFDVAAKALTLNLSGQLNTFGSCRISIPKKLLSCSSLEKWILKLNGNLLSCIPLEDNNYTYLYFTYMHEELNIIEIKGENAVPEFSDTWLFATLMISSLAAITLKRLRAK